MPISTRLKAHLDANGVKYMTITHSRAYTAQEIAAAVHCPGVELAKTVIVKLDGKFAMAVLPASYKVDFKKLKELTGAKDVALATEEEFRGLFPECELGAMPPFGNLYNLPVYASDVLAQDQEIFFNAGTHTEVIRMAYADFERVVKPTVANFAVHV